MMSWTARSRCPGLGDHDGWNTHPVSTILAGAKEAHPDDVSLCAPYQRADDAPDPVEVDARDQARGCIRRLRDEVIGAVLPQPKAACKGRRQTGPKADPKQSARQR
jgi:hypothetical protein